MHAGFQNAKCRGIAKGANYFPLGSLGSRFQEHIATLTLMELQCEAQDLPLTLPSNFTICRIHLFIRLTPGQTLWKFFKLWLKGNLEK